MHYSPEQEAAFQKYVHGHNVFVTGPGGTGKSELIRRIFAHAEENDRRIHVTALTGCASILLRCRAKTLHSWAGIGLGNQPVEQAVRTIRQNFHALKAWKDTDILVVDEVSMLSLKLFNLLFSLGQSLRNDMRPFGGIQLIFSGDFFQLPPVGNRDDPDSMRYCFESLLWHTTFPPTHQILLSKIFRQDNLFFSSLLNQVREGRIKRSANDFLVAQVGRPKDPALLIQPTKLFPLRRQVEEVNAAEMARLDSEPKVFVAEPKFLAPSSSQKSKGKHKGEKRTRSIDEVLGSAATSHKKAPTEAEIQQEVKYMMNNLACEQELTLKIGAQVMCLINVKDELTGDIVLCNGSQGIVQRFCTLSGMPIVQYNNGHVATMYRHGWESEKIKGLAILQVPLVLCWAMTIHKSQGASLDAAEIDIGNNVFECGQSYVALSRVRSLEGLYLTSYDARKIKVYRNVQEYYEQLREAQQLLSLPAATPPSLIYPTVVESDEDGEETNSSPSLAISSCSDDDEEDEENHEKKRKKN